ncbi:MAG: ferritin-like domain-containing protein [Weeksellaceae bacterium]|nr:ferritin-like domain-containing protein [Weeksellaceae bacterium]
MEKKSNSKPKKASKQDQSSSKAKSLRDLFEDQLKDIYWAENALVKSLPNLVDHASNNQLQTALKEHLAQTKKQVERLDEVFKSIGVKAEGKKCDAMAGLLEEADSIISETSQGAVRDAGIICAAQKVEHYEIATYGTLAAFARTLNERPALELLLKTLGEEKKSDAHLSAIADTTLNSEAMSKESSSKA